MKKVLTAFAVLFIIFAQGAAQTGSVTPEVRTGYEAISATNLRAYESVLTSDSLEGRETASLGQKRAAQYIASLFHKSGLKPLGSDGSFFQHFDVIVTRLDTTSSITATLPGAKYELVWGRDFVTESMRDTVFSAPVAFIGHTDTELSDSDRTSLAARMVFVLIGKRELAGDTSRAQFIRRLLSPRREPTAAAIIMVADDAGSASMPEIIHLIKDLEFQGRRTRLASAKPPQLRGQLRYFISTDVADKILCAAGRSLSEWRVTARAAGNLKPLLIDNVSLTVRSRLTRDTLQTENVVGLLEGSDDALKNEVVAFTAHYDHLGKKPSGAIFHGADDDGSGTSTVLDLAQAFSKNSVRPKRGLLFMTVVGEEKGLLGSDYYTTHPIIPLHRTIADLNIDMIGRVDETHAAKSIERYAYVIGSDKISTELDSLLVLSNNETERLQLDYTFNDESDPNQFYRRSDHYNFARFGVPIVFFFTGIHEDYHQPTDTADKLLYDRMVSIGRLVYATGWKLANMPRMLLHNVKTPASK
jgi:hypothetical protein